MLSMRSRGFRFHALVLLIFVWLWPAHGQNMTKRNDRPQQTPSPSSSREDQKKTADPTHYTYEFKKAEFNISHIVLEHDASGHGKVTFERRGEDTPIVEPLELSPTALSRIFALWSDLKFLDSTEDYQSPKNFAHLGTHWLSMDDGKRKRTAELNWSNNKSAWALVTEYRNAADQVILVFEINLAREMQPLNTPQLLNEMESRLSRNELSDPHQLVPLLNDLRTDEHIPLIARNHADRILKKIGK